MPNLLDNPLRVDGIRERVVVVAQDESPVIHRLADLFLENNVHGHPRIGIQGNIGEPQGLQPQHLVVRGQRRIATPELGDGIGH